MFPHSHKFHAQSKAHPVPQHSPSQDPEEQHPEIAKDEAQVSSLNPEIPASEEVQSQTQADQIVEEEPENANPHPVGVEASREIPSSVSNNQLPQDSDTRITNPRPETRVQKPDERASNLLY